MKTVVAGALGECVHVAGVMNFLQLAEAAGWRTVFLIAWCAIPLFWFNQMDGRGPWDLEGSIREHQQVIAYS